MKQQSNTIAYQQPLTLPLSLGIVAAAAAVPFLVHLIPFESSVPLGAIWIPLFYIPLVAVLLGRFKLGFVAGILAPFLNFLITGQPAISIVLMLAGEVALFSIAVLMLYRNQYLRWIAAPLGYLMIKFVSAQFAPYLPFQQPPWDFWVTSIQNAVPGIALLALLNVVVVWIWKNRS